MASQNKQSPTLSFAVYRRYRLWIMPIQCCEYPKRLSSYFTIFTSKTFSKCDLLKC